MNTHESYVSLETAKMLKEAGFDWKVDTLYFSMQDDDYLIKEELIKCTDYFPNGDHRGTGNLFHNWNQLNTKRGVYYAFVSKKNFLEFDYETIKKDTTLISAPTLSVAQRWLREERNVSIDLISNKWGRFDFRIQQINVSEEDKMFSCLGVSAQMYNTYEQALEVGIKKCLEEDCITDKCSEE